ncbi:hypothetical protein [Pseudomonas sp. LB1P83]
MTITIDMSYTGNFSDGVFTFSGRTERQKHVYLHAAGEGGEYARVFTRNGDFVLTASGLPGKQYNFALRTSDEIGKNFSEWFEIHNLNVAYSKKGEEG